MIVGFLNENDEPIIQVGLILGEEKRLVDAVIDTKLLKNSVLAINFASESVKIEKALEDTQ